MGIINPVLNYIYIYIIIDFNIKNMNFSKFLGNFKYKKFNPSINEWNNSIYSFKKSNLNVFSNTKLLNSLLKIILFIKNIEFLVKFLKHTLLF